MLRTIKHVGIALAALAALLGWCMGQADQNRKEENYRQRMIASPPVSPQAFRVVRQQGMQLRVLVDPSHVRNEGTYRAAIAALCLPQRHCFLGFWIDESKIPTGPYMTDEQMEAETANYVRNPKTGWDKFMWSCKVRPETPPDKCF